MYVIRKKGTQIYYQVIRHPRDPFYGPLETARPYFVKDDAERDILRVVVGVEEEVVPVSERALQG